MKALSIRQPWAWLIVNGHKDIENRTWPTRLRGRVLIHAGKQHDGRRDEWDWPNIVAPEGFDYGGIVGVATITDCVRESDSPWHMTDCWGFRIVDARPLPFVACKGALGFFDVPADVLAACREHA